MKLAFKPDFETAKMQWEDFWIGENKRPLAGFIVPKQGVNPVDPPQYLDGRDGNFQPVIDKVLAWADTHDFVGEAIPHVSVEWGPNTFSAFLGAELQFYPEDNPVTSWCKPFVYDWDQTEIRFMPESHWWQMTIAFFKELKRQCDGKLLINPPTLVANLDSLAAIRGTEELLIDLLTCPEKVENALDKVCQIHNEVIDAYAEELEFSKYGSVSVEGTYCLGKHSRPQCDISCMLSTDMFRKHALPCLMREADIQDAVVYHLDGSGAIQHLEAICSITKLDVICWVPSAGNDMQKDWYWLFEKIDRLGKGQVFSGLDYTQIKQMWETFKSKKLYFHASAETKTEAEDFIAKLEKLSK